VAKLTSALAGIQKQLQGGLPAAATPAPTTPPQALAGAQQLGLVAMQGAL
jgi:hypothetical protein